MEHDASQPNSTTPALNVLDAPTLSAHGLAKSYTNAAGRTHRALRGVSLDLHSGEWLSVVGPSGAGKSTLLSLVGLLEKPDSGRIFIAGRDAAALSDAERSVLRADKIGFIFQTFNLVDTLDVLGNIMLPLKYAEPALPAKNIRAAALTAAEAVGLADRLDHRPAELSGGEMQRVAIARAMAAGQELILADEPTGNLDSDSGRVVLELLRARCEEGAAALVVTHDPEVAELGDAILALRDGCADLHNCRRLSWNPDAEGSGARCGSSCMEEEGP